MTVYNLGIIGYGLSAKTFHIPFINIVPAFKLGAIVRRRPNLKDETEAGLPTEVKFYQTAQEICEDREIHVIVVATPPNSHAELAKLALTAGKHVVVDKPFTFTSTEAQELITLARAKNLTCSVYQNRRWDSDFLTLAHLIKAGTLGRVVEFETHFDRHRPDPPLDNWKAYQTPGTGALYDLGSHLIDQVLFLFGMPQRISAFLDPQRAINPNGLQDSCTVLLHYDTRRLMVTVKSGVISPEASQLRFWVCGERASFKKHHFDPQEAHLRMRGLVPGDRGFGQEMAENSGTLTFAEDGKFIAKDATTVAGPTYAEFYRKLALALDGELGQIPVPADQIVGLVKLLELARESSRLRRTLEV